MRLILAEPFKSLWAGRDAFEQGGDCGQGGKGEQPPGKRHERAHVSNSRSIISMSVSARLQRRSASL